MPLILQVISYRDQPLPNDLSCVITGNGGTLGRAPGNDLTLDDPGKYISRAHACIDLRDGVYYLSDTGSNPSVVNDRLLGNGREVALGEGDSVVIGDYRIEVRVQPQEADDADSPAASDTQTLAVFMPPPVAEEKTLPPLEVPLPPRSEPGFVRPQVVPDALAAAQILDSGSSRTSAVPLADPLGLNLFVGASGNPLPTFDLPRQERLTPAFHGTENDHLSPELQALPTPSKPTQAASAVSAAGLIPDGYDPLADLLAPLTPQALQRDVQPDVFLPPPEAQNAEPVQLPPVEMPAPAVPSEPLESIPSAATSHVVTADDDVLKALLEGLGLPNLRATRSPTELARLVGEMLREATAGTMNVLMARAMTKRESHIDMTMIGARSNNPLKFFPDPASALSQMLTADAPAYLPAVQALSAAFDDLKAHELAVIAGMREALSDVVGRFEPAHIERRMAPPGTLDRWLPSSRKARLWDRLGELYNELVRDGDEDLQRIFGEKFSAAYQQQVSRLRDGA